MSKYPKLYLGPKPGKKAVMAGADKHGGSGGLGMHKHGVSGNCGKSPKLRHYMRLEAEKNEIRRRHDPTQWKASVKDL